MNGSRKIKKYVAIEKIKRKIKSSFSLDSIKHFNRNSNRINLKEQEN